MNAHRRFLVAFEPIVASLFFAPESFARFEASGLDPLSGYFVGRAAPLGRASAAAVTATFFNWSPSVVERSLRWDLIDPEDAIAMREEVAGQVLRRLLGDAPGASRAVELLRVAVEGCPSEGRPLFAANAALPWPTDPLAALWHGSNAWREFRGDGHIAALVSHGLTALEALVIQPAYIGIKPDFYEMTRDWGADAYASTRARLEERGFMDGDGALTDAGRKFRDMIEMETDRLAAAPVDALGPDRCEELLGIIEPMGAAIVAAKGAPRTTAKIAPSG